MISKFYIIQPVELIETRILSSIEFKQPCYSFFIHPVCDPVIPAGMNYVFIQSLSNLKLNVMLRWTIIFLVIAIIAAIFGFGGVAAGAAGIAKVLFFIFLVLFVLSLISGRRTTDV